MSRGAALNRGIRRSLAPAVFGALVGFLYAKWKVPEETFKQLVGMYCALGAAGAIMFMRVLGLVKIMFSDYFGKKKND